MIISLHPGAGVESIASLEEFLSAHSFRCTRVTTQRGDYLVVPGTHSFDLRLLSRFDAVADVHRVTDAYKLVSKKWKVHPSSVELGDGVQVKAGQFSIIAGPCSIESEAQIAAIIDHLVQSGVRIMRGGAFKPRTSPYTFRGLGLEGLKMCYAQARSHGIKLISEVVSASDIDDMHDYVDVFQVGTRNTQNFSLLHELGRVRKPVLIKRGMSGTLEELLQSAEYVFANGNEALILCERGIRTFENAYRNTLDLNSIPVLKEKTHLPVIVDPSHGIGIRRFIEPMALASVMAGADGVMIEIHGTPEKALSDGAQTLNFEESTKLFTHLRAGVRLRDTFE